MFSKLYANLLSRNVLIMFLIISPIVDFFLENNVFKSLTHKILDPNWGILNIKIATSRAQA